jgi:hypothetical protein
VAGGYVPLLAGTVSRTVAVTLISPIEMIRTKVRTLTLTLTLTFNLAATLTRIPNIDNPNPNAVQGSFYLNRTLIPNPEPYL